MRLTNFAPLYCSSKSSALSDNWSRPIDRFIDEFFNGPRAAASTSATWQPKMNIAETDQDYQIHVELPGVEEKNIDVTLHDGLLTVKGSRSEEKEQKDKNFHRIESFYGSFERSVQLPDSIKGDEVAANFKNGVLAITVPKLPEIKPTARKIAIQAS